MAHPEHDDHSEPLEPEEITAEVASAVEISPEHPEEGDMLPEAPGVGNVLTALMFVGLAGASFVCLLALLAVESTDHIMASEATTRMLEAAANADATQQEIATIGNEIRKENQTLLDRISERKQQIDASLKQAAMATEVALMQKSKSNDSPAPESPSGFRTPDAVSVAYVKFKKSPADGKQQITGLDQAKQNEIARLAIGEWKHGLVDASTALDLVSKFGSKTQKLAILRDTFSRLSSTYHQRAIDQMVGLVAELGFEQAGSMLPELLSATSKISDGYAPVYAKAIESVPPEKMETLGAALAHPDPAISGAVGLRMPESQKWEVYSEAIAGDDFAMYNAALQWIAAQEVNPTYRGKILNGLTDTIYFRHGIDYVAFELFAEWADSSQHAVITEVLARPFPNDFIANRMLKLVVSSKLPLSSIIGRIQRSNDKRLLQVCIDHPEQTFEEVIKALRGDLPPMAKIRWIEGIAQHGSAAHLESLQRIVADIEESAPATPLANSAKKLLSEMQSRLQSPPQ